MLRPSRTSVPQETHRWVCSLFVSLLLHLYEKKPDGDQFYRWVHVSSSLDLDKEAEAGAPEGSHHPGGANHQPDGLPGQRDLRQNRPATLRTACGVGAQVCLHLSASAGPQVHCLQARREVCGESTFNLEKHSEGADPHPAVENWAAWPRFWADRGSKPLRSF